MTTPEPETHRDSESSPRVYVPWSRYAHNVWDVKEGACIYCKRKAPTSGWKGLDTEYQRQKALSLPYCREKEL